VDPARAELQLFDALDAAGLHPHLYPHRDRCDVSLGEEVGIDVKDYTDPARLARKLNRTIGGLAHYPHAIVAVADRRTHHDDYLGRLREQLTPGTRNRVEVLSVRQTIRKLVGAPSPKRRSNAR